VTMTVRVVLGRLVALAVTARSGIGVGDGGSREPAPGSFRSRGRWLPANKLEVEVLAPVGRDNPPAPHSGADCGCPGRHLCLCRPPTLACQTVDLDFDQNHRRNGQELWTACPD
jgi:hypothetical protein